MVRSLPRRHVAGTLAGLFLLTVVTGWSLQGDPTALSAALTQNEKDTMTAANIGSADQQLAASKKKDEFHTQRKEFERPIGNLSSVTLDEFSKIIDAITVVDPKNNNAADASTYYSYLDYAAQKRRR